MGWVISATPQPLYPRESDPVSTVKEAVWAGLNGCGKPRPHPDSTRGPSRPKLVAIPTELSRPIRGLDCKTIMIGHDLF